MTDSSEVPSFRAIVDYPERQKFQVTDDTMSWVAQYQTWFVVLETTEHHAKIMMTQRNKEYSWHHFNIVNEQNDNMPLFMQRCWNRVPVFAVKLQLEGNS